MLKEQVKNKIFIVLVCMVFGLLLLSAPATCGTWYVAIFSFLLLGLASLVIFLGLSPKNGPLITAGIIFSTYLAFLLVYKVDVPQFNTFSEQKPPGSLPILY